MVFYSLPCEDQIHFLEKLLLLILEFQILTHLKSDDKPITSTTKYKTLKSIFFKTIKIIT